ncbi:VOC family protein [Microbaculum marinum]|uniref:VOC family protein n=1 Tax=Microbaculum marinum TaxID=1764581 RepID=A0AAW9RUZ4_9HYPH
MQQQISVITLAVSDLERSRRFYTDGFGWTPVFENEEIVFYQMNGFVLGTWLKARLEDDMGRGLHSPGAFTLAHNVSSEDQAKVVMDRLAGAGGRILLEPAAPPHGGIRGYIADPDDHTWEIAFNPAWPIDENGHVTFGAS